MFYAVRLLYANGSERFMIVEASSHDDAYGKAIDICLENNKNELYNAAVLYSDEDIFLLNNELVLAELKTKF